MDPGASTYMDIINRVPVASNAEMCMVDLSVRERIFPLTDHCEMAGGETATAEAGEDDSASESDGKGKKRNYPARGRALFRAASSNEVPLLRWFHENFV